MFHYVMEGIEHQAIWQWEVQFSKMSKWWTGCQQKIFIHSHLNTYIWLTETCPISTPVSWYSQAKGTARLPPGLDSLQPVSMLGFWARRAQYPPGFSCGQQLEGVHWERLREEISAYFTDESYQRLCNDAVTPLQSTAPR